MATRTRSISLIVLVCVGAWGALWWTRAPQQTSAVQPSTWPFDGGYSERGRTLASLVSSVGLERVKGARHVEAARVVTVGEDNGLFWDATTKLEVAHTRTVSPDSASNLRGLFLNEETYAFARNSKKCGGFQPRHVVRFADEPGGKSDVCFLICFKCGDLQVVVHDAAGRPIHRLMSDFSPGRGRLMDLISQALPDDDALKRYMTREH